jgi:ferritin-like metal-binding protein YciE
MPVPAKRAFHRQPSETQATRPTSFTGRSIPSQTESANTLNEQQQNKIVQYLNEAHATELTLARELQAQIAMTPSGRYRSGLEQHLQETCHHAQRVEERLGELGQGSNPLQLGVGVVQSVAGQAFALAKTPLNVIRGSGGEEKVLKNAKDSCASEALEIATYTSLARLASAVGDQKTERLAKSVLEDEQRMLKRVLDEIPRLTDAVARAEFDGQGSYDVTETGGADAVRKVGGKAKRTARQARKAPGVARAEGTVKGAVASESDLAIVNYDSLSVEEIQDKLSELSQIDLAKVNAYERKNQDRSTVTSRIDSLQGDEPWPGYDELGVDEVRAVLSEGDEQRIKDVRAYERKHKARAGVIQATERELTKA